MEILNIPGAAGVLNFVVLLASLSAMNSQLYVTSRMMFSPRAAMHPKRWASPTGAVCHWAPLPCLALACAWPWCSISTSPSNRWS